MNPFMFYSLYLCFYNFFNVFFNLIRKNLTVIDERTINSLSRPDCNLFELNNSCKLSIIKLIEEEHRSREQRKSKIVLTGLPYTGNDKKSISRLFKSLNQTMPIYFERIKSKQSSNNYPMPVICELCSSYQVQKLLKISHKLKSIKEFHNVYINPYFTANERIISSFERKLKKINFETNFSNNSTNLKQNDQSPNQNLNKSTVASTKPDKCSSVTAPSSSFDQNKTKIDCAIIKGFRIQLLQNDLQSITTGEKLNDKIVNFYLSLLCNSLKNLKALTIDSILINKILSSEL
ncbi:unnamed protein product [Brachionus calyciflorus]|uniref:Uncharacterized protein n=1 Tax=Brachionus calyciflorus TaxID=104777 RepID=A0A813XUM5_9BILA|nr:unnamed protein product [Brachionus calyciflorus]